MRKILEINDLNTICIVGVGLLGGSVGLAFRAAGASGERVGVGRRRRSIALALEVGAVDRATISVSRGVQNADLVIVATPIGQFEAVFRQLADYLPDGAIVTDVGSTKGHVMDLAARLLPDRIHFVGSHPMAGSENAGVEFARADLFQRAHCLIVPSNRHHLEAVGLVEAFWQLLGMRTARMTAEAHDRLVARISHLPHVVASALIDVAVAGEAIDLAATGFQDTTRVASGHPKMWLDIVTTNRRGLTQAIDELVERLQAFRQWLATDQSEPIARFLEETKLARDAWIQRRYAEREIEP